MRPSCASSVNTGTKLTVMISSVKNSAGPTSAAESATMRQRFSGVSGVRSMCLCMFSIITIAPSIMAPMAIAMPPSDMMLAFSPCQCMTVKAARIPTGRLTMATSEERTWNRKAMHTRPTTRNSSNSLRHKLSTARPMSAERSYTVKISTPSGRPGAN